MGIPHGKTRGNSYGNPVGMGWGWELKFLSHGNPDINSIDIIWRFYEFIRGKYLEQNVTE